MEYWISKGGKKEGPLMEWDIRGMIEEGGLKGGDLIWHSDMPRWERLEDYTVFRAAFHASAPTPAEATEDAEMEAAKRELKDKIEQVTGKKLPDDAIIRVEKIENHHWVRRGFAKVFDLFLYFVTFFILANYAGIPFGVDPDQSWLQLTYLIPFFIIEGFLIYYYGLTPGKYLLGLKVRSLKGVTPLNFNRSLLRSAMSWFFGMAMGIPYVFFISMALTYFSTKKRGLTTWDAVSRSIVTSARPINAYFIIAYIVLSITVVSAFNWFITSHDTTRNTMGQLLLEHAPPSMEEKVRKYYKIPKTEE